MARPSKLTDAQWAEVQRRLLAGESARALAREFPVSESAIRQRLGRVEDISAQSAQVRETAEKLVVARTALEALPLAHRAAAETLADQLHSISRSLASAAELSAKTSHRLHAMANGALQEVDDSKPFHDEASVLALRTVATLTKMGNEAAQTPINLLAANKEKIRALEVPDPDDAPTSGVLVVPGMAMKPEDWSAQVRGTPADVRDPSAGRVQDTPPPAPTALPTHNRPPRHQ
jgi:hypothetical protein